MDELVSGLLLWLIRMCRRHEPGKRLSTDFGGHACVAW
jgi:hypothetical protein